MNQTSCLLHVFVLSLVVVFALSSPIQTEDDPSRVISRNNPSGPRDKDYISPPQAWNQTNCITEAITDGHCVQKHRCQSLCQDCPSYSAQTGNCRFLGKEEPLFCCPTGNILPEDGTADEQEPYEDINELGKRTSLTEEKDLNDGGNELKELPAIEEYLGIEVWTPRSSSAVTTRETRAASPDSFTELPPADLSNYTSSPGNDENSRFPHNRPAPSSKSKSPFMNFDSDGIRHQEAHIRNPITTIPSSPSRRPQHTPSTERVTLPIEAENATCGFSAVLRNKVIEHVESPQRAWPWIGRLLLKKNGKEFLCGATLIGDGYVLTAAHCLDSNSDKIEVLFGDDLRKTDSADFDVQQVIRHPEYNFPENDIALLRIQAKDRFKAKRIPPVCLPPDTLINEDLVETTPFVAGWNISDKGIAGWKNSTTLWDLQLTVLDQELCQEFHNSTTITDQMLCAQHEECLYNGDSGGGLFKPLDSDTFAIIGVGSFANTCPSDGSNPVAVFTRVTEFLPWIREQMSP